MYFDQTLCGIFLLGYPKVSQWTLIEHHVEYYYKTYHIRGNKNRTVGDNLQFFHLLYKINGSYEVRVPLCMAGLT